MWKWLGKYPASMILDYIAFKVEKKIVKHVLKDTSGRIIRPIIFAKVGSVIASPFLFGYTIYRYKRYDLEHSIDKVLATGTIPEQLGGISKVAPRDDVLASVRKTFIERGNNHFGVVLGPTGTGKTYITREACCMGHPSRKPYNTSGILYMESYNLNKMHYELARTVGMRIHPNFVDMLFEKFFFTQYSTYHKLPQDLSDGIAFALETLAERAVIFKKKHSCDPVIFIDGVDLLAKRFPKVFKDLVDKAKVLGNSGRLKIVFASSEGEIMKVLNETSSKSRAGAKVLEVLDLDSTVAQKYLEDLGMPKTMTKAIYERIGGRILHLSIAVEFMKSIKRTNPAITEADLAEQIVYEMEKFYVPDSLRIAGRTEFLVLKYLYEQKRPFHVKELEKTDEDFRQAVDNLVTHYLLRYNVDGFLYWHSKLAEEVLIRDYFKKPC